MKMKNFYLDLLQRLTVGTLVDMPPFRKDEIQRLLGPLQTLPLKLVEVNA